MTTPEFAPCTLCGNDTEEGICPRCSDHIGDMVEGALYFLGMSRKVEKLAWLEFWKRMDKENTK